MFEDRRRLILLVVFVIGVLALGVLMYFVFWRGLFQPDGTVVVPDDGVIVDTGGSVTGTGGVPGSLPGGTGSATDTVDTNANTNISPAFQDPNDSTGASTLPAGVDMIAAGGPTLAQAVFTDPVDAGHVIVSTAGNFLSWYDSADGSLYRVDLDSGLREKWTDQKYPGASEVEWSSDGTKVLLNFPDGRALVYDLEKNRESLLALQGKDYSFSEDGEKLAFKTTSLFGDEADNWIAVINSDGSGAKPIEPYGDQDVDVDINWAPNSSIIATYRESVDATSSEVYFFDEFANNLKSLVVSGRGFLSEWGPDGTTLLYSVHNSDTQFKPELWVVTADGQDATGTNRSDLRLNTWADKCAFAPDASKVYCGVPQSLPSGVGMFRDKIATDHIDDLYQIDLSSGLVSPLAVPTDVFGQSNFQVAEMFVSSDGDDLYFVDAFTGGLQKIRLR